MKDLCGGWWEMLLEKKKKRIWYYMEEKKNIGALVSVKDKRLTGTDVTNYIMLGLDAKVKSAS